LKLIDDYILGFDLPFRKLNIGPDAQERIDGVRFDGKLNIYDLGSCLAITGNWLLVL
jgi:hypothetical protein